MFWGQSETRSNRSHVGLGQDCACGDIPHDVEGAAELAVGLLAVAAGVGFLPQRLPGVAAVLDQAGELRWLQAEGGVGASVGACQSDSAFR